MKKKVSTKKSEIKVNPRVSDCYEETEGFTGQATSHRGVVIRKGKGGFEAPRFGLENYRSLGAIKSAIDKSMKEKEGETNRNAEGNETQKESNQSISKERYQQIIEDAKSIILELNRYEKETGKDYKTGKEVTKGGTMGGDDTHSKVMRHMHKVMGAGRMGAGGPIQPRGKKKDRGGPTPGPVETPAQRIAKKRAAAKRAQDNMSSRYD